MLAYLQRQDLRRLAAVCSALVLGSPADAAVQLLRLLPHRAATTAATSTFAKPPAPATWLAPGSTAIPVSPAATVESATLACAPTAT